MNGKLTNSYYWRIGRSYLALEDKFEYQSSWKEAKERKLKVSTSNVLVDKDRECKNRKMKTKRKIVYKLMNDRKSI